MLKKMTTYCKVLPSFSCRIVCILATYITFELLPYTVGLLILHPGMEDLATQGSEMSQESIKQL